MNISSLFSITLLPLVFKLKFSIEVSVTSVSSINSSFWKGSISISSLIFSVALDYSIRSNSKTTKKKEVNFQLSKLEFKKLQTNYFKSKDFYNFLDVFFVCKW